MQYRLTSTLGQLLANLENILVDSLNISRRASEMYFLELVFSHKGFHQISRQNFCQINVQDMHSDGA